MIDRMVLVEYAQNGTRENVVQNIFHTHTHTLYILNLCDLLKVMYSQNLTLLGY